MAMASSQQSFLTNALTSIHNPKRRPFQISHNSIVNVSCNIHKSQSHDTQDSSTRTSDKNQLAKLAMVTLAAGVLTFGSIDPAFAAKSGGRVGGQAFRSAPRQSQSAPRASSPRINNSRTNVFINPPIAPPLVGGYGYGYGWGWSPFSYFAPGPSVAIGVGGGFDTLLLFMLLGAAAAVVRRFFGSRAEDDDDY